MTDVTLLNLHLHNFKGIKKYSLDPDGKNITVFGDNATGKTTLADACWWLLEGKDSEGRADFEIKRLDEDGTPEHNLDHEVEATFQVGENPLTLKKVLRERWVKRRGQTDREFDGHTTDHFVNRVPVTAGEFTSTVEEIASGDTMRILTDPYRFSGGLHWRERRQILLDVTGTVSDEDIIAANDELADLPDILEGRKMDDHKAVVLARRKEINENLDQIPVRIDEADRALPDTTELPSMKECESDLKKAGSDQQVAEKELARIEAGGQAAEKTKKLREIEASIQNQKTWAKQQEDDQKKDLREEREKIAEKLSIAKVLVLDATGAIGRAGRDLAGLTARMNEKRGDWEKINSETFEHDEPDTCAACNRPLPVAAVEEARQKAQERFNTRKAERLQEISEDGKTAKAAHEVIEEGADQRKTALDVAQGSLDDLDEKHEAIKKQLMEITVDPDLGDLEKKKQAIETEIEGLKVSSEEEIEQAKERIQDQIKRVLRIRTAIDDHKTRERGNERLEELRGQEKNLAAEFEELERQLHLMDLFTRAKVDLLTGKINERFQLAHFKLFDILVNGGIEECCEASYRGVPWRDLNHGAQINVGLDIIKTLHEHYGISLPVWVDQSESITKLLDLDCQTIRLVVSPDDQTLRTEEA